MVGAEGLYEKKLDYGFDRDDFEVDQEITVRITLHEYRALVRSDATKRHDIDEANNNRWKREAEIKSLKEENSRLKEEIYDLKERLEMASCKACTAENMVEEDMEEQEEET